jgi:hypothetical protein
MAIGDLFQPASVKSRRRFTRGSIPKTFSFTYLPGLFAPMATVRLSTKEVQIDDVVYSFDVVQIADAFEACVATTADADHCALEHQPVSKRPLNDGNTAQNTGESA